MASAILEPRTARSVWTTFYAARLLSQAAQALFFAALILPSAAEGSAGELSATVIAMMAAAIVLGYPGGAAVDRIGPARSMATGSLARFAVVLGALALLDGQQWAWAFAFLYSAVSQIYSPAELALVHRLRREEPCSVHASLLVMQYVGQGAGLLVLAPVLLVIGGSEAMIAGSALLFAGVAASSLLLTLRLRDRGGPEARRPSLGLRHTLRFFGGEPRARYAAGLLAFADLSTRVMLVALPLYLRAELDVGSAQTAVLVATGAAGVGLGLLWAGRSLSMRLAPRAMRLTLFAAVISALALSGLGHALSAIVGLGSLPVLGALDDPQPASFALALPAMLVLGASFSVAGIAARSVISETAPALHQARVFASVATFTDLVVIVPLALAGLTAELLGARPVLLVFGAVGVGVLVLLELVTTGRGVPSLEVAPELASPRVPELDRPVA
jgi:MFS family permease